jgi:hypothetical protein
MTSDVYVAKIPELDLYCEFIINDYIFYMTIDISKHPDCDVFVRFYPSHFEIWIRGRPFDVNYPKNIIIDPDTVKRTRKNGIIDVTAKIVKRNLKLFPF